MVCNLHAGSHQTRPYALLRGIVFRPYPIRHMKDLFQDAQVVDAELHYLEYPSDTALHNVSRLRSVCVRYSFTTPTRSRDERLEIAKLPNGIGSLVYHLLIEVVVDEISLARFLYEITFKPTISLCTCDSVLFISVDT